jgi:type II secretory pathway predicted ATPase ExeA
MYQTYWQLDARPFDHSADARFYYPGPSQQAALLKLRYVIESRRGAAVLAGESGLGKTLVVQSLLRQLADDFRPRLHIVFPQMPGEQLLSHLADALSGVQAASTTIDHNLRRIESHLVDHARAGRHAVIVIDEAHLLRELRALETIRLLLNFEHNALPLATFLLVGQTSLVMDTQRLPALDERLAVKCMLARLSLEETSGYIQHRLAAAGAKRALFERRAVETIFELTSGIPRRINRLCDLALLVGYGEELKTISAPHIEAIHDELLGTARAA